MTHPKHLLTVWNPAYSADPLDEHLRILVKWAEGYRNGTAEWEDVYVWWAKLRSSNREAHRLPHHADILELQKQMDLGIETHLYLTDYRSLYVARLEDVTDDDVLADDESDHMPEYYRGRRADLWFRIVDIRRIVSDDTPAVISELKLLRNTRYHDRPVSIYGGMVDLPLIVTRVDERQWFPEATSLTDGRLWVEHDADLRSEADRMARELRENLLGEYIWSALDPTTRMFLASAEAVFRMHRADASFDFSGPALGYAKAVEVEVNALLFPSIRKVTARLRPADRTAYVDGRPIDLAVAVSHQPLGTAVNLIEHDDAVRRTVKLAFPHDWEWLIGLLPHQLGPIVAIRNPAAHSERARRENVAKLRAKVLGIGCEGLIVQIARAGLRASGR